MTPLKHLNPCTLIQAEHVNTDEQQKAVFPYLHQRGVQLRLQTQAQFAVVCDLRAAADGVLCDLLHLRLLLLHLNHSSSRLSVANSFLGKVAKSS